MSDGSGSFAKNALQEWSELGPGALEAHVGQGTVFVRPGVFVEPPYSMRLQTEFHGSWLVTNAVDLGVEQEFMDSGRLFSAGVAMEASAFGCDSKVLDRAVGRLLESAFARSLDSVEIMELRRHQDSGLDYVTILAVAGTRYASSRRSLSDRRVSSALRQLEGERARRNWRKNAKEIVMKQHNIFITEPDMEKLRSLLNSVKNSGSKDQEHLAMLEEELDRAHVISAGRVPADVVTMNSRVRMTDLDTGKKIAYTLVFPRDADFSQGKISVLAPIGTAILGYRSGHVIEWNVPGGKRKLRVEEILHQPEAAERAVRALATMANRNAEMGAGSRVASRPRRAYRFA